MSAPDLSKRKKAKRPLSGDESGKLSLITDIKIENSPKRQKLEDRKEKSSKEAVWSDKDDFNLLDRIMEGSRSLPELQKYSTTYDKLNWEDIKFGDHSASECKDRGTLLMVRVRKYRTLGEIVDDVKALISTSGGSQNKKGGRTNYTSFEAFEIPKKPMSPYFRYFSEMKDSLQKHYPQLSQNDLFKILSEKFNKLPDKKKKKYTDAYNSEMETYQQQKESLSKSKQSSDPTLNPKIEKPLTPYLVFANQSLLNDKKLQNIEKKIALEKLREKWSVKSDESKCKYIKEALRFEWIYLDKINKHLEDNPDLKVQGSFKSSVSKAERAIFDKMTGKPEKPPNSGYSMFSCEQMRALKMPTSERMNVISAQWKELSEEAKTAYATKATEANKEYKKKMDIYLKQFSAEEQEWIKKDMRIKKKHPKGDGDTNGIPPPTGKENKKRKLFKGEPKRPPTNAYAQYTAEMLSNLTEIKPKGRMTEIAKKWKVLSDEDKKIYKDKSQVLLNQYNEQLERFMKGLSPEDLRRYEESTKSSNHSSAPKKVEKVIPSHTVVKEEKESSSEDNSDSSDDSESGSDSSSSDDEDDDGGAQRSIKKEESSDDDADDSSSNKSSNSSNSSSKAKKSSASNDSSDDSSDDSDD